MVLSIFTCQIGAQQVWCKCKQDPNAVRQSLIQYISLHSFRPDPATVVVQGSRGYLTILTQDPNNPIITGVGLPALGMAMTAQQQQLVMQAQMYQQPGFQPQQGFGHGGAPA